MMTKQDKIDVLEHIQDKELKMKVASVLDKAMRFERMDSLEHTSFLDLYELSKCQNILDRYAIPYLCFSPFIGADKKVLFFIPSYLTTQKINFSSYVSCIKMIPKQKGVLTHPDYMGSIYHLGIKRELLGDIIAKEEAAYVVVMQQMKTYVLQNLQQVGRQEITLKVLEIASEEVKNLSASYTQKEVTVTSFRIDTILSQVFPGSRNEIKKKISQGDLYLNCKNSFSSRDIVQENDIISLRKCGKIKIGKCIRKTKNDKFVVQIQIYS